MRANYQFENQMLRKILGRIDEANEDKTQSLPLASSHPFQHGMKPKTEKDAMREPQSTHPTLAFQARSLNGLWSSNKQQ